MSYSGYVQQICSNGHYAEIDCWTDYGGCVAWHDGKQCDATVAYTNEVDTTNHYGGPLDYPEMHIDIKGYMMSGEVTEQCQHCNHVKTIESERYCAPPGFTPIDSTHRLFNVRNR